MLFNNKTSTLYPKKISLRILGRFTRVRPLNYVKSFHIDGLKARADEFKCFILGCMAHFEIIIKF